MTARPQVKGKNMSEFLKVLIAVLAVLGVCVAGAALICMRFGRTGKGPRATLAVGGLGLVAATVGLGLLSRAE